MGELKTVAAAAAVAAEHARQTDKMGCPRGQPARKRPRLPTRAHLRMEREEEEEGRAAREGKQATWLKKKSGSGAGRGRAGGKRTATHGPRAV